MFVHLPHVRSASPLNRASGLMIHTNHLQLLPFDSIVNSIRRNRPRLDPSAITEQHIPSCDSFRYQHPNDFDNMG